MYNIWSVIALETDWSHQSKCILFIGTNKDYLHLILIFFHMLEAMNSFIFKQIRNSQFCWLVAGNEYWRIDSWITSVVNSLINRSWQQAAIRWDYRPTRKLDATCGLISVRNRTVIAIFSTLSLNFWLTDCRVSCLAVFEVTLCEYIERICLSQHRSYAPQTKRI